MGEQFAYDETDEAHGGEHRAPDNHFRAEPVELLALIEHYLQARQPNAQKSEPDVVNVRGEDAF